MSGEALRVCTERGSDTGSLPDLPQQALHAVGGQLRLWFSAFAHLMLSVLRAEVLRGTDLAQATVGQIRLKLFKIAARVKISCRRIHLELAGAYPYRETFQRAWGNLSALPAG